jgi:hypothetical protein
MAAVGTTLYNNTLTLIRVFRSFPIGAGAQIINGVRFIAYSPAKVYAQLLVVFPDSTMTLDDVTTYLALGAKSGVFRVVACVDSVPQYLFNNGLVGMNFRNVVYLQACPTWDGQVGGNCNGSGQTLGFNDGSTASTASGGQLQGTVFLGANNLPAVSCS